MTVLKGNVKVFTGLHNKITMSEQAEADILETLTTVLSLVSVAGFLVLLIAPTIIIRCKHKLLKASKAKEKQKANKKAAEGEQATAEAAAEPAKVQGMSLL